MPFSFIGKLAGRRTVRTDDKAFVCQFEPRTFGPHTGTELFVLQIFFVSRPSSCIEETVFFEGKLNLAFVPQQQAGFLLGSRGDVYRRVEPGAMPYIVDKRQPFVYMPGFNGGFGQIEIYFSHTIMLPLAVLSGETGIGLPVTVFVQVITGTGVPAVIVAKFAIASVISLHDRFGVTYVYRSPVIDYRGIEARVSAFVRACRIVP